MAQVTITISDTTSGEVRVKSKWHPQPRERDGKMNLTAAQMLAADLLGGMKKREAEHLKRQEVAGGDAALKILPKPSG